MTIKDLKEKIKDMDDNSIIICGAYNGYTDTYGVVDYINEDYYNRTIYNDLYGTPGQIDGRLMRKSLTDNEEQKCVYIGTSFPSQNGIGEKKMETDIQKINEDPDYLWKTNGFDREFDDDGAFWSYLKEFTEADENGDFAYEMVNYYRENDYYMCELHCRKDAKYPPKLMTLSNPTLEELRDIMKFMGFEKELKI